MDFSPLNVILVKPAEPGARPDREDKPGWIFGFGEDAFEREAGMITKMEVRAVALASLQLARGQVLWDIGAATGSVSIEAERIARLDRVFAVERNESRYTKLLKNLDKFGSRGVKAVCTRASEAILAFPDPDRVFIGGSGDDLHTILEAVSRRLLPGGRVVQTVVLLQTLEKVSAFWKDRGFELSVVQLQVNRSVRTGNDLRLEALNPVFIVSAWRKS
jgi:precorrin-6Y C5,15-methyltransferase (decarboxylating)